MCAGNRPAICGPPDGCWLQLTSFVRGLAPSCARRGITATEHRSTRAATWIPTAHWLTAIRVRPCPTESGGNSPGPVSYAGSRHNAGAGRPSPPPGRAHRSPDWLRSGPLRLCTDLDEASCSYPQQDALPTGASCGPDCCWLHHCTRGGTGGRCASTAQRWGTLARPPEKPMQPPVEKTGGEGFPSDLPGRASASPYPPRSSRTARPPAGRPVRSGVSGMPSSR